MNKMNVENNTGRYVSPHVQREMLPAIIQTNGDCRLNVVNVNGTDIFCENWYKTNGILCLEGAKRKTSVESTIKQKLYVTIETGYDNGVKLHKKFAKQINSNYGKLMLFYTIPENKFGDASSYADEASLVEDGYEWALRTKEKAIAVANDRQAERNSLSEDFKLTDKTREDIEWTFVSYKWYEYNRNTIHNEDGLVLTIIKKCLFMKINKIPEKYAWQHELKARVKLDDEKFNETIIRFRDEDDDRTQAWLKMSDVCKVFDNPIVEVGTVKH